MFYFVPSWYDKGEPVLPWSSPEQPWFRSRRRLEFDDTVHQLKMFCAAGEDPVVLDLSYMPARRRLMHRLGLGGLRVISVFDLLQQADGSRAAVFSFRDLDWPGGIEWNYTPRCVMGYLEDRLYVRLDFGEEGCLCQASYYTDDTREIYRTDYYDDRGFLSSSLCFLGPLPVRWELYGPDGALRVTQDLETGLVTLESRGEESRGRSRRRRQYDSMAELLTEAVAGILAGARRGDLLVLAADPFHNEVILEAAGDIPVILSFFGSRMALSDSAVLRRTAARAGSVVTDTAEAAAQLRRTLPEEMQVYDISPFDTRLRLGQSQRLRAMKIFLPLDGLEEGVRAEALGMILCYMKENEDAELVLGLRHDSSFVREETAAYLRKLLPMEAGQKPAGNSDGILPPDGKRLSLQSVGTEQELIECLRDVRLIVDVSEHPDLYLQIAGISAGIPQVNLRPGRYVEHLKDGYILGEIRRLPEALRYYLEGLEHWNEALVHCVHLSRAHDGSRLIKQWKELAKQL